MKLNEVLLLVVAQIGATFSVNETLIGPKISESAYQSAVKIIIVDQQINSDSNVEEIAIIDLDYTIYGGSHGYKVKSVIENQLIQANVNNYTFYSFSY